VTRTVNYSIAKFTTYECLCIHKSVFSLNKQ